jgi:hypothetical protein
VREMAVVPLNVHPGPGGDVYFDRFGVDYSHIHQYIQPDCPDLGPKSRAFPGPVSRTGRPSRFAGGDHRPLIRARAWRVELTSKAANRKGVAWVFLFAGRRFSLTLRRTNSKTTALAFGVKCAQRTLVFDNRIARRKIRDWASEKREKGLRQACRQSFRMPLRLLFATKALWGGGVWLRDAGRGPQEIAKIAEIG